jgi:hypothetical protein
MRTEDDIRAAFRQAAEQAPDADALLAAVREQLGTASAGSRQVRQIAARRWVTPLAAAAAVIAVTAAAVAIANGQTSHRSSAVSGSGLGRLPRYYMSLALTHQSGYRSTYSAVVKDTMTGATLATVRPPKNFGTFAGVAGAADDRTFVLAARKLPARPGGGAPIKLYRVVYHPTRDSVTLTALPIPQIPAADTLDGLAMSPSGASLAVGISISAGRNGRQQLRVYSLRTGAVKVWQQSPTALFAFRPSFAENGVLAFNWAGPPAEGTWLLRTGTGGGKLTRNSQLAVPAEVGRYSVGGSVLSGDGSVITAVASTALPSRHGASKLVPDQFLAKIVQFAVPGGRAIRTLWTARYISITPPATVLWSSSSGDAVVVQSWTKSSGGRQSGRGLDRQHLIIGILHDGRVTPIPGMPAGISYPDTLIGIAPVLAF